MNFASLPDRRAELDPQGAAVSDGRQSLTNAQLLSSVLRTARQLHDPESILVTSSPSS
ncbi:hypothetical protein ACFWBR_43000 [Streptomyces sp. NPDC060006]|uniref:hypothetical protein n=1 Tax=unclassified Streptomyces TaxID=2593676 RepID=UPI0036918F72